MKGKVKSPPTPEPPSPLPGVITTDDSRCILPETDKAYTLQGYGVDR